MKVCCECCEIPSRLGTCSKQLSLVDYLTQANKDQLLWGFCYFLCHVFFVCILGPAWQTIEFVYNTHHDLDGCFYRKKCVLYMGKYGTAEPCYLELKPISLRFALLFSVIYYWLSWTQLSQTPYLEQRAASLVPVLQTNLPHYLELPAVWANCCFPWEFKTSWVLHCTVASFCVNTGNKHFPLFYTVELF